MRQVDWIRSLFVPGEGEQVFHAKAGEAPLDALIRYLVETNVGRGIRRH